MTNNETRIEGPRSSFGFRHSFGFRVSSFGFARHYIEQEPGAPPHRPHDGASDALADFPPPDSAPTANTLSARAVFGDPHVGHFGFLSSLIERCNCSNRPPQPWHVYS